MRVLSVSGHRPNRLGGYGQDVDDKLYMTAVSCLEQLKPTLVITGMALGWDQAVARACVSLQISFTAACPFQGQESIWPQASRERYRELLDKAMHIEYVSPPPYRPHKLMLRNQWMIDHSDECLALWDGTQSGGTFECLQYAMVCGKPLLNAWDMFVGKQEYPSTLNKL